MRPNRSTAARTAASASARLVTSSFTGSRSFDCPNALDTRSVSRPVATTEWPAAKAGLAKSVPIPRPAPVMNQIFFLLTASPFSNALPSGRAASSESCLPARRDNSVPGSEGGLNKVNSHAAAGARDEPHLHVAHNLPVLSDLLSKTLDAVRDVGTLVPFIRELCDHEGERLQVPRDSQRSGVDGLKADIANQL